MIKPDPKKYLRELDSSGELSNGTEQFAIYEDDIRSNSNNGYPRIDALFSSKETLHRYHMIFLPCLSSSVDDTFILNRKEMIRQYVSAEGRIYNSCMASRWSTIPLPDDLSISHKSSYSTNGTIMDQRLAEWIQIVTSEQASSVPFYSGYASINAINEVNDGHGLEKDNKIVRPYSWVIDNVVNPGQTLMATYNYDFGKVFYSVYETSKSGMKKTLQEFVLIYVILEVGVCSNPLPPPPPK